jgi:hypothetical protein
MEPEYGGEEEFLEEGRHNVISPRERDDREASEVGVIRELSPKKVLEQLRRNLKGEFYDYEKKNYMPIPGFEPLLNDKGIAKYMSIISSVITDLVTFSSYGPTEIPQLVLYVCEKAIPIIHINYKKYGIKEKSDLQILDIQIFNLTLAAFKKALGAGDRNVIGRTISENIVNRSGQVAPLSDRRNKGFFSKMNPFV